MTPTRRIQILKRDGFPIPPELKEAERKYQREQAKRYRANNKIRRQLNIQLACCGFSYMYKVPSYFIVPTEKVKNENRH